MRINQDFLNHLAPIELSFIQASITKLCRDKITDDTTNYDNVCNKVEDCPYCGSYHYVKNGFNPHHKQKYRCQDCGKIFTATTETMFTHSKTSFNTWSAFIACELNGLSLEQDSVATGLSVTTCFHMRHKLYKAISKVNDNVILHGLIELDAAYTKINLKGTRPQNMPRSSKHRGRKNASIYSRHLRGLSNHKVCLVTATDENDNILFKIAGLGQESYDKYDQFKNHFVKHSTIISDDKPCIQAFTYNNEMKTDVIPSLANQKRYTASSGNSISSVNELHTEAKKMIRNKKGISTRHLQAYLDWLVFRKRLRYTLDMRKWKMRHIWRR